MYHTFYKPTEWTVPHRPDNTCFAKIITNKNDDERIVGFHVLGPNAGEITQGFGLAMKYVCGSWLSAHDSACIITVRRRAGVTKAILDQTVGIHPTSAETFTSLTVTKSSGASAAQAGC